jgi:hypothetical protein
MGLSYKYWNVNKEWKKVGSYLSMHDRCKMSKTRKRREGLQEKMNHIYVD